MQIGESKEQPKKADLSIRDSFESGWKVTALRFQHDAKQFSPITSTDEGMPIEQSEPQATPLSMRRTLESGSN
jgi:hypothetical protein